MFSSTTLDEQAMIKPHVQNVSSSSQWSLTALKRNEHLSLKQLTGSANKRQGGCDSVFTAQKPFEVTALDGPKGQGSHSKEIYRLVKTSS